MQLLFFLFMALMSFTLVVRSSSTPATVVTLAAGPITGLQFSPTLFKFLGIPYAKPPTGNARFASPVAYPAASILQPFVPGHHHSNFSIQATAFGNICPQSSGGAENCLFLNVFTASVSPLALSPVMFWVHGGSFIEGSGSDPLFDGSALTQKNVVVVTYNYRLGILGFLDGGGDFPTVNMGLQDTILALTWVQNNILFFGGDASRVTVFGESSGGQMIRALMSSPKAKNLFKRAIIQSDPQSYPLETRNVSQGIVGAYALSQLGCTTVECARSLSLSEIVTATTETAAVAPSLNLAVPVTPLSPTIDGTWVQGDFSQLIASGSLPVEVDVVMGTVLNEATPQIYELSPNPLPTAAFQYIMALFIGPQRASTICACPEFALSPSDPDTVRNTLSNVGTMFFWTCAIQANAITYASKASVYLYELLLSCTHPDNANDPMCTSNGEVCHEDDIGLVFGTCSSPTTQQTALSNEIMARWAAFATNGNPNIPGQGVQWNPVSGSTGLNVLRFSPNEEVNETLYSDVCGPVFGSTVPFNFQLY